MCNRGGSSIHEAKKRVRRYARLVQKAAYPVSLTEIQVVTISAVYTLSQPHINLRRLTGEMNGQYEPELFPTLMFMRDGIRFLVLDLVN